MLKSFRALLGSVLRCRQIQGYMGYCAVHGTKLRTNARSLGATYVRMKGATYVRMKGAIYVRMKGATYVLYV